MSAPMINLGPDSKPVDLRPTAFDLRELILVGAVVALLLLGIAILVEVRDVRAALDERSAGLAKELAGFDRAGQAGGRCSG